MNATRGDNRTSRLAARRRSSGCRMVEELSESERNAIRIEVERLRLEHRDIEDAIDALLALGAADQLQIQRLKKRKLLLRDRIAVLEDQLTPDIIA